MDYLITTPLVEYAGENWLINTRVSGIYRKHLNAILSQIFAMLSHHNKIFIFRFDLHMSGYTADNKPITDFIRQLSGKLDTQYKFTRIGYCWAREHDKAKGQHYHFALILDGNKIQSPRYVWEMIKDQWEFAHGRYFLPKQSYYRIGRNDRHTLARAIYRLSYLAKGRSKDFRPIQTKTYGNSRIKIF